MFFLDPSFLKIVIIVVGVAAAIYGLSFLAIRHRSDVLEQYFLPEEDIDMEEDFFRRRALRQHAAQTDKQEPQENKDETATAPIEEDEWGHIPDEFK